MLILLSPAKTVDFSKPLAYPTKSTIPFVNESTYLMNHLKSLSKNEIQSVMKISNDLATLTELNIRKSKIQNSPLLQSVYSWRVKPHPTADQYFS